jgi:uncharacterized membrane protein YcaP (DUF421 family)
MSVILLKTLICYFALMLVMGLMGKRQLGQMQISELISAFLVSEIASAPITNRDFTVRQALISMTAILILEIALPFLTMKIPFFRKILDGSPSYLIYNGKLRLKSVKKARMTVDELCACVRAMGISDLSKVRFAILETNGTVSIFPFDKYSPATPADMGINVKENGICHNVVVDGAVNSLELDEIGMSAEDLKMILRNRRVKLSEIFLMLKT